MSDTFGHNVIALDLIFSTLWIVGFAIIFSALSIHHHKAQINQLSLSHQMQTATFQLALWIGLLLVTLGFAGGGEILWQRLMWLILAIMTGMQGVIAFRSYQQEK